MTVYLIHFSEPLGSDRHHAQHYIGFANDVDGRLYYHRKGSGSAITRAAKKRGLDLQVVRTWEGGKDLERKLKARHEAPRLCPLCQAQAKANRKNHTRKE